MTDALKHLQVWDRLTVGPVRVEPRRVICPYQVGEDTFELVTSYSEDVLNPWSPADVALATLLSVQPALNYGLFAKEIRIYGPLDDEDRRWLRAMAANTACEILTNKLMVKNPFLTLEPLPAPPDADFSCNLNFPDPRPPVFERWTTSPDRALILSSGGKDSLLSLGILEELGAEAHPIFANEAGRHWFTALNAWRHLERTHPRAARVWTNCDRLFTWLLRRLPFVRQDFGRIRADIYAIRLWTVAVFLFATLPLARKRGLGRLVIGDEFDTTAREVTAGIPHYGALYDQSRWFDEDLSRFFDRKGWGIVQFSVLRTCSELLIEKALATRYPELLAQQVSCHSAHVEGERVLPCGACEKCRRIVGMLTALGKDPAVCGYSPEAIAACMERLADSGAKQIAEDAEHLAWMLVASGHVPADSPFGQKARRSPVTMKLRYDPEASPHTTVPSDLRPGLRRLLLEVAEGAVERRDGAWVPFDPLSQLGDPHPFERLPSRGVEDLKPVQKAWILGEMTWPQAQRRFRETDLALLPVGAFEQHGLHLPLDIDAWDAEHIAHAVAEACTDPKPLVLPLIPYGVSYHHEDFPGTLSVSPDTLARMVHEVGVSVARWGIRKLLILNGHGGNAAALHFAAQLINRDAAIFTAVDTGETADAEMTHLIETAGDVHAGEYETSTALATRPHLVHMEHARAEVPRFDSRYLDFGGGVSVEWYARTRRISDTGTMGDPTRATAEKGREMWDIQIRNLVALCEHLKSTPLERLHRPGGA
ncbi:MAG: creatininase family protein [Alphaproteobacteria bacterium]|nr:creatininase family protein [Alphaproteobacteria bacterium]